MNQISRKLRSKSGASLLIVLVFMMFCLFVGGSVLAAASANGYRVAHLSDQQDFLNQRSAGLLLADEIDGTADVRVKLTIRDVSKTETPVKILPGGGTQADSTRKTVQTRTVSFSAPFKNGEEMTVMQRLMYETAVCRYLRDNSIRPGSSESETHKTVIKVELDGFWYDAAEITSLDGFWYKYNPDEASIQGTISISGQKGTPLSPGEEFTTYTAYFTSGTGEDLFDFLVTFGDFTQMTVTANAYMSQRDINQPAETVDDPNVADDVYAYEVEATTRRTTVYWEDAHIQKGGA